MDGALPNISTMNSLDTGLLLVSDFRKTFLPQLQSDNREITQLLQALKKSDYTPLEESDILLLAHDLSFIFTKYFYDFEKGILSPEGAFTKTAETVFLFKDYLLYFSFFSSFSEKPSVFNPNMYKENLSPFLFVNFVHNLIDVINLGSPNHDCHSIEFEMCRQLVLNARELCKLDNFIALRHSLAKLTKVNKENEKDFFLFFQNAFIETVVFRYKCNYISGRKKEQINNKHDKQNKKDKKKVLKDKKDKKIMKEKKDKKKKDEKNVTKNKHRVKTDNTDVNNINNNNNNNNNKSHQIDNKFFNVKKRIRKVLKIHKRDFKPFLAQFIEDKNLLAYNTYLHKRYSLLDKSWVYSKPNQEIKFSAETRLEFLSQKIGNMIGKESHKKSIGNSIVRITFSLNYQTAVAFFKYNQEKYSMMSRQNENNASPSDKNDIKLNGVDHGIIEVVFPVFANTPLKITFSVNNRKLSMNKIVIPSLKSSGETKQVVLINKKAGNIFVDYKFYNNDEIIPNASTFLNMNPTRIFDFVCDCTIHEFIVRNSKLSQIINMAGENNNINNNNINNNNDNNNENNGNLEQNNKTTKLKSTFVVNLMSGLSTIDEDLENNKSQEDIQLSQTNADEEKNEYDFSKYDDYYNNDKVMCENTMKDKFPIDFWLLLCDLAIKYSIPCSYFFITLLNKLTNCWCNSKAFIDLYCVILYNCFYAIEVNEDFHFSEKDTYDIIIKNVREKASILLSHQIAKPELYENTSITSLILILSLCMKSKSEDHMNELTQFLSKIFFNAQNNVIDSILNKLIFEESETECTSMGLFSKSNNGEDYHLSNFQIGPNDLPCCQINHESIVRAADLILFRCKSISSFYLKSFLPAFVNQEKNTMDSLLWISQKLAEAFVLLDPQPNQQLMAYFVHIYQQLYFVFNSPNSLKPSEIFNESIEKWLFNLSNSVPEMINRSIELDTFAKYSNKLKTSLSINDLFEFFHQGFSFVKNLKFPQDEVKDKMLIFLSICSAFSANYIDSIMSIVSKPFRGIDITSDKPVKSSSRNSISLFFSNSNSKSNSSTLIAGKRRNSMNQKSKIPSWCPDLFNNQRVLTFDQMFVIANNLFSFRRNWLKFIDRYTMDYPQSVYPARRKQKKATIVDDDIDDGCQNVMHFSVRGINDPCVRINKKILLIFNFCRLNASLRIKDLLMAKMWQINTVGMFRFLVLKEEVENDFNESLNDFLLNDVINIFSDYLDLIKDNLYEPLHLKVVPQLVRGVEDGVFEALIPFAFYEKTKLFFPAVLEIVSIFISELMNELTRSFNNKREINSLCVGMLKHIKYIQEKSQLQLKDLELKLKNREMNEKNLTDSLNNNNNENNVFVNKESKEENLKKLYKTKDHIVLLQILIRAKSSAVIFKKVNKDLTLIRYE